MTYFTIILTLVKKFFFCIVQMIKIKHFLLHLPFIIKKMELTKNYVNAWMKSNKIYLFTKTDVKDRIRSNVPKNWDTIIILYPFRQKVSKPCRTKSTDNIFLNWYRDQQLLFDIFLTSFNFVCVTLTNLIECCYITFSKTRNSNE